MKRRLYMATTALVFLFGGRLASDAQTKPFKHPPPDLISSKSIPAPAPLSPTAKLARVKTALKGHPQKTIDSATLGGPQCSLSVQTPLVGNCAVRLLSPFSVFFDINYALMSDVTETSDSVVLIYFTSPQPAGIYILDFAISITDYVD